MFDKLDRFNYQAIAINIIDILFVIDYANSLAGRRCNNHINSVVTQGFPSGDFFVYLVFGYSC